MKSPIDGQGKGNFIPVQGIQTQPPEDKTFSVGADDLTLGLEVSLNPKTAPLGSCSAMDGFKFSADGITHAQDFRNLNPAGGKVLNPIRAFTNLESVAAGVISNKTLVVSGDATTIRVSQWDDAGGAWVSKAVATVVGYPLQKYSVVALQGTLMFAPGGQKPFWSYLAGASSIGIVDATADIRPRFLAPFGDRVLAFQDLQGGAETNLQSLAWSADGGILDFTGTGTGQSFLIDTRSHTVDAIQGGAALSSNIFALIRQRSIMRLRETGNVQLSVGVTHWIEGIGTESPFSISIAEGGIVFLGHDYMPYFLTESGLQSVGESIIDELRAGIDYGDMDLIETVYDPIQQEWWLCVQEDGITGINKAYIFSLGKFLQGGEKKWRVRNLMQISESSSGISRMGYTTEVISP